MSLKEQLFNKLKEESLKLLIEHKDDSMKRFDSEIKQIENMTIGCIEDSHWLINRNEESGIIFNHLKNLLLLEDDYPELFRNDKINDVLE